MPVRAGDRKDARPHWLPCHACIGMLSGRTRFSAWSGKWP